MTVPMSIGIGLSRHDLCSVRRRRGEIAAVPKVSLEGEFVHNALDRLLFRHRDDMRPFCPGSLPRSTCRSPRRLHHAAPVAQRDMAGYGSAAGVHKPRDAGRHVADLDTDGGTAETCALTSGGTPWLTSRLGARFRAHPCGPRWTPAGRCRDLAIGTSRDVVPCKPSVGHSTWVVEGGRGRLAHAPCLPAGRDAATLTGIRWPRISRR
jgi:hypothetical protein